MKHARFDWNDIIHELSDEQLAALMEPVAAQARQYAETAHEQLMVRLRADIMAINPPRPPA